MSQGSTMAQLQEALLLKRTAEEAERMPSAVRERLRASLLLARQGGEAADTLWANGHAAEAIGLARRAFEDTLNAAVVLADADADSDADADADSELGRSRGVFVARAVSADTLAEASAVLAKLRGELPMLDDDVDANDADTFRAALRIRRRLHDALSPAALSPKEVKIKRLGRWATLVTTLVLVAGAAFLMLRTPHEAVATASAYFANAAEYAPDKAIDDEEHTEWLLPDGQTGWLEVRLSPPRSIQRFRIRNGHNRHFQDRAVKEYSIELFDSDGSSIGSADGEFERFAPDGEWAELDLGGGDVRRIRFTVKSFHRTGAALAEIDWVE